MGEEHVDRDHLIRLENEINVLVNLSAHYAEESHQLEKERKKSYITQKVISELREPCTLFKAIGKFFVGTSKDAISSTESKNLADYENLLQSIQLKKTKTDEGIDKGKQLYAQLFNELNHAEK